MTNCFDCAKLNLQYQNLNGEFWCGEKDKFFPSSHHTCISFVSKDTIIDKELYSREDILTFLNNLLKFTQGLSVQPNYYLGQKTEFILKLREIIYLRDLPHLDSNGKWCYKVQCTMLGLYLNMVMKSPKDSMLIKDKKVNGQSYNLIKITGKYLTIEEFAELNHTTEGNIRQQLRNGLLPYAKKFGSSWLIPEFSRPIKDADLTGWFVVPIKIDPFLTLTGDKIIIEQNSFITIIPQGRTNENKKIFSVIIDNYEPITEKIISSHKHELGATDKNSLLFYLISNPDISYHSNDIGITNWLFN